MNLTHNDDVLLNETLNVEESNVVKERDRSSGSKKQQAFDNSTRREASLFEIAEASAQEHVWSLNATPFFIVQVSSSQPINQRAREGRGRDSRGGRGGRGGEGTENIIAGVSDHMVSFFRF